MVGLVELWDLDADYAKLLGRIFMAGLYVVFSGLYVFWLNLVCIYLAELALSHWLRTSWSFEQVVAIIF